MRKILHYYINNNR